MNRVSREVRKDKFGLYVVFALGCYRPMPSRFLTWEENNHITNPWDQSTTPTGQLVDIQVVSPDSNHLIRLQSSITYGDAVWAFHGFIYYMNLSEENYYPVWDGDHKEISDYEDNAKYIIINRWNRDMIDEVDEEEDVAEVITDYIDGLDTHLDPDDHNGHVRAVLDAVDHISVFRVTGEASVELPIDMTPRLYWK